MKLRQHTKNSADVGCGLNESYWQFPCKEPQFKKANKYFLEHGHHPCAR